MISFVVPAHNEERLLGRTLASIHAAARDLALSCEVVVADDASTDGTAAVARAGGARVVGVQCRHIAGARNAGARAAMGDTLIFVDADTVVSVATLRATLEALRRGAVGGGATVAFDGRVPLYVRLLLPPFRSFMRGARLAAGCYVFCTRAAFEAAGGFDERFYAAEEVALSRSLGRQGRFVTLRQTVTTSGRKLRTYSAWEVLRLAATLLWQGPASVRSRTLLSPWYGERREDPDAVAGRLGSPPPQASLG